MPAEYTTETRGKRRLAAAAPAGEGKYSIVKHDGHTQLAYILELPEVPGPSQKEFAKDTAGLLDALKISKADILGWSLGSYIAQELTLTNPDKVSNLILYASGCGGKNATPTNPKIMQMIGNANPDYLNYFPMPKESVSAQAIRQQLEAVANWTGSCNAISNITQPTLVIVGTNDAPLQDSLMLARSIPGSWVVQIRDAGHGLNRAVITFLEDNHEHKELKN